MLSQICIHHFENIVQDVRLRSVVLSHKTLVHALLDHAMRAKTNDMRLLDRALAEKISMQDELIKITSTTQWALDQNKQRKWALQGELMTTKGETQRAPDQI